MCSRISPPLGLSTTKTRPPLLIPAKEQEQRQTKETVAMTDHKPYKVWWIPQIPGKSFQVEVDDLKTAALLTDVLADYDAFQFANRIKPDYANAGGICEWNEEDGEWWDVDEDDVAEAVSA